MVRVINTADNRRFDADTSNHSHIHCLSCGRVDDMPETLDKKRLSNRFAESDYKILGYNIDYYGICPECKKAGVNADRFGINKSPT